MMKPMVQWIARGKLTVLLFHKVPQLPHPLADGELGMREFERILTLVHRMFRILPLQDALPALKAGRLPPRAACITFDDGYPDWLRGPVPLLERLGVHATFFVTTGQLQGLPMWNERILHAVAAAPEGAPDLTLPMAVQLPIPMATPAQKREAVATLDRLIKYQPPDIKEQLLQQLEAHVGLAPSRVPVMSADDLRAIHAKGFGIGAHAVSHPILARCEPSRAYAEMAEAKETLESLLRAPVDAFAYPNGIPQRDFGPEHVDMVKRAGYRCALTTHRGAADPSTSLFQIPRFTPWGPSSLRMVAQLLRNFTEQPVAVAEAGEPRKKVLMVAFHFPPQAGSSGVLRTLNFVKHLPTHGVDPMVLTAHPRAYVEARDDLLKSIPDSTHVTRAQAWDAARHFSIRGKYPDWFALPDRWSSWWLPATWAGMQLIRKHQPDIIWSTYPIATAHLIAAFLARRSGLPWVADFRDPMVNGQYPSNATQRRLWSWLERQIFQRAAACVFTTERAAALYRARYPESAAKCHVIENGFDEEVFSRNQPNRMGVPEGVFFLLHSGIIYPKDRDPTALFAAMAKLLDEGLIARDKVKIRFRAPHHGEEVLRLAREHDVEDVVDIQPPIAYANAIAEMMGADALLLIQGSSFNAQIPAKLYEYLRSGRPILALTDEEGDTAAQLDKFSSAHQCQIDDSEAVWIALQQIVFDGSSEKLKASSKQDALKAEMFSRKKQCERLVELFEENSIVALNRAASSLTHDVTSRID